MSAHEEDWGLPAVNDGLHPVHDQMHAVLNHLQNDVNESLFGTDTDVDLITSTKLLVEAEELAAKMGIVNSRHEYKLYRCGE